MKNKHILFISILSTLLTVGCFGSNDIDDVQRVDLIDDEVKSFVLGKSQISEFKDHAKDYSKGYAIRIGEDDSLKYNFKMTAEGYDSVFELSDASSQIQFKNLLANTKYTWTSTSGDYTNTGFFYTQKYAPRILSVEGIYNVRDIGGYNANDTYIKQGLVFRGSEMDEHYSLTTKGLDTMTNFLQIKTDLDLRSDKERGSAISSPLGESVTWTTFNNFKSYANLVNDETEANIQNIRNCFKVFADKSSYPIYLHCYQGADRTGTVADLLEGLVGVSEKERKIDYSLTTFSGGGDNYRDADEKSGSHVFSNIEKFIGYKVTTGSTYSEKIESYLINKIGLTQTEVNNIKDILLGKTKIDVEPKIAELYNN